MTGVELLISGARRSQQTYTLLSHLESRRSHFFVHAGFVFPVDLREGGGGIHKLKFRDVCKNWHLEMRSESERKHFCHVYNHFISKISHLSNLSHILLLMSIN